MKTRVFIIIMLTVMTLVLINCGKKDNSQTISLKGFFPEKIDSIGLSRTSQVKTYAGESLFEYINGGAEIYHQYGFIEVATADYSIDEAEITVDIYKFENSDRAYGLYTTMRPDEPLIVELGVEGFASETSLDFVKGSYLIRLISYNKTSQIISNMTDLANVFAGIVPGKTEKSGIFDLFPQVGKLPVTDKIFAESFLGLQFLTDVYCQDYILNSDTVRLFITDDTSGGKFLKWTEQVKADDETKITLQNLPYDENYVLLMNSSYHGLIIAGLINNNLTGMVGYDEKYKNLLTAWLNSLK